MAREKKEEAENLKKRNENLVKNMGERSPKVLFCSAVGKVLEHLRRKKQPRKKKNMQHLQ